MPHRTPDLSRASDPRDPLHLFRRLPTVELSEQELADMKRAVHQLCRAKAIEAGSVSAPPLGPARRQGAGSRRLGRLMASRSLRLAAALGLLIAASLLLPDLGPQPVQVALRPPAASVYRPFPAELAAAEALPLIEDVSGDAELIQIEDTEMSLVVVAAIR